MTVKRLRVIAGPFASPSEINCVPVGTDTPIGLTEFLRGKEIEPSRLLAVFGGRGDDLATLGRIDMRDANAWSSLARIIGETIEVWITCEGLSDAPVARYGTNGRYSLIGPKVPWHERIFSRSAKKYPWIQAMNMVIRNFSKNK